MISRPLYKAIPVACGAVVVVAGVWVFMKWKKKRDKQQRIAAYPKNTVIMCHFGRSIYSPNLSEFTMKLETYLRMTKIPYQDVPTWDMGPKNKIPYIYYNGQVLCDSHFIIQFLNKEFGRDLNKGLTTEQLAIARAFQKMIEENTYWCILLIRWVYNSLLTAEMMREIPRFAFPLFKKAIAKAAYHHGTGRHSQSEVISIMKEDLKALSDFLGSKKFLMGDEASEVDCAVFGQLSQIKWGFPDVEGKQLLRDLYPNLDSYCERIKETYWPDWDQCLVRK